MSEENKGLTALDDGSSMDDLESLMRSAGEEQKAKKREPTDNDLKTITELATKKIQLEKQVEEQEAILKKYQDDLRVVTEVSLPDAMEAVGMAEFKLTDGSTISIKEDVLASIKKENQDAAYKWLNDMDQGGIIKTEVSLPFGKGQEEEVNKLCEKLSELGYSFEASRSIHHSTLKAFVNNQMKQGVVFPDCFSIFIRKVASIKLPKEARPAAKKSYR